ncbi:MAG: MATE family efflux transporter [Pseudomonadota bacterium]
MAFPMLGGIIATMAFNAVDTFFVGRLGATELAAMSFTFPVVMTMSAASIGLGAGTSSVIARALGAGDTARVRRLTTDALLLAIVVSVLLAFFGYLMIRPVFAALGASPELIEMIARYMTIWYLSAPLLVVPMVAHGAIRATGNTQVPMWIMIGGALLNGILDPLLIFGVGPFPRLELEGAALALLLARVAMCAVTIYLLAVHLKMLDLTRHSFAVVRRSWRAILHVGMPAAGTNMIIPLCTAVATAMLATYGADVVAGFGVATRIESLALVAFYALSAVIGPMLGQNLSVQQWPRLHAALNSSAWFCAGFGLLVAIGLYFFGASFAAVFNADPVIVEVAGRYLWLVPFSYGAAGMVMTANAGFNGIGQPLPAVIVSLSRMGIVFLPLAWVMAQYMGYSGIFAAYACANLICGVGAFLWLRRRINRVSLSGVAA